MPEVCWIGGRIFRRLVHFFSDAITITLVTHWRFSSILSDDRIIEYINNSFVPFLLNLTYEVWGVEYIRGDLFDRDRSFWSHEQKMPTDALPALGGMKMAYAWFPNSSKAFATENLIDPLGKHHLGSWSPLQPDVVKACSYEVHFLSMRIGSFLFFRLIARSRASWRFSIRASRSRKPSQKWTRSSKAVISGLA